MLSELQTMLHIVRQSMLYLCIDQLWIDECPSCIQQIVTFEQ